MYGSAFVATSTRCAPADRGPDNVPTTVPAGRPAFEYRAGQLDISACVQTSGIAEPVGLPGYNRRAAMLSLSQTCSGRCRPAPPWQPWRAGKAGHRRHSPMGGCRGGNCRRSLARTDCRFIVGLRRVPLAVLKRLSAMNIQGMLNTVSAPFQSRRCRHTAGSS